jgi:hypothetical protein
MRRSLKLSTAVCLFAYAAGAVAVFWRRPSY